VFVWIVPGAFVLFYFAKPRQRVLAALPTFTSESTFAPHVRTRIAFSAPQEPNARAEEQSMLVCLFVVDSEGFSVRLPLVAGASTFEGEAEFLAPQRALARMYPQTKFAVLVGNSTRGNGEILAQVVYG
jgi:hypothetical protein